MQQDSTELLDITPVLCNEALTFRQLQSEDQSKRVCDMIKTYNDQSCFFRFLLTFIDLICRYKY